jgi:uncharacterized protein (DUF2141 family)
MPKRTTMPLFLLFLGLGTLAAETLTVQVENAEPGKGHLMVGVFNDEAKFPYMTITVRMK